MAAHVPLASPKQNFQFQIDSCEPQLTAARNGKIELHALSHGRYPGRRVKATQLEGVSSLGFWDGVHPQDWGLDPHRNEGVEICFLETGNMDFSVDAKNFALHSGHFTLTRPWQLHKLGAPNIGPGRMHWLILDVGVRRANQEWRWPDWLTLTPTDRFQLTRKLRHNDNAVWNASPALAGVFCGLSECVLKWEQPHYKSRTICLLNQLLLEILTVLTNKKREDDLDLVSRRRDVDIFLHDLAGNSAKSSEQWSLEKMAEYCDMGITAFSKYCRELVNTGPVDYLNQCRLDHAARQLREHPSQPVIEIAFQHGFNSSSYFATVFRRRFRVSPREYRKNQKPKSEMRESLLDATGRG